MEKSGLTRLVLGTLIVLTLSNAIGYYGAKGRLSKYETVHKAIQAHEECAQNKRISI